MFNLDNLLKIALTASNEACKAILKERKNLITWQKADKSPISSADIASNETINEILKSSDIEIISEESLPQKRNLKALQNFWLVDPLDGTSGFIKGGNEFCVMISLIHQNRPILALIQNPTTNDIFYAHKDSKVYKNNEVLKPNEAEFKNNKFKALLSVNHLTKEDENFAKNHNLEPLNISSGLKFCAILQGFAGVYKRFESLHTWDLVAGDFLVNQNGGFMGNFSQNKLFYNATNYQSEPFICVSRKEFLKDFL